MHRLLAVVLFCAPMLAAAESCEFTAKRDFDVDAKGLDLATLRLGSSDLRLTGVPGLASVEVRGRACASNAAWLDDLRVEQERRGGHLTVTTRQDRGGSWSGYAYIDVEVRVPASLAVEIRSGSGDTRAEQLASLDYEAGSGDLVLSKVAGKVALELGSGDVEANDLGEVEIASVASGDVNLRDVRGDVRVGGVGSGDLGIDNVGGGVTVGHVGSGDVTVSHVDRDVAVESVGSGDVSARDVGGDFSVRSKGSGDVHHSGVRGKVDVPRDDD